MEYSSKQVKIIEEVIDLSFSIATEAFCLEIDIRFVLYI